MRRRLILAALLVASFLALPTVTADVPDPAQWPGAPGADPDLDTTAHSLRISGSNRFNTSLAAALHLRSDGNHPYGTPDRTSGGAADLGSAAGWWGLGTCPFSVIVAAGDIPADALAASSLSDPTDGSSEPLLTRSASADEFFDPVGGTARVDTEDAPIVLTASARQGATRLSDAARTAVTDLADGGCTTVNTAVVVGGPSAVPEEVEAELISLGLTQVFRVSGGTRYATAAAIARALGTGDPVPDTTCDDPDTTDSGARAGFYGNAAPEYRTSATDCTVLSRTVVLADGVTGADALAAGWWTARWQVPILLVAQDGVLPTATRDALTDLDVDHVVVLGGRGRIPEDTAVEAATIADAELIRVAGPNRYATSVAMAGAFGGWFPTGQGADHDGSLLCLAASSGSGEGSLGWPDALGAGPWCASAAETGAAPRRALPPVQGAAPRSTRGNLPSHDLVPVLLTPVDAPLAFPVADLLEGAFDPADTWCSSVQAADGCLDPGFVVTFGGPGVVRDATLVEVADAVAGATYVVQDDLRPTAGAGWYTTLDMSPIHAGGGAPAVDTVARVCLPRVGALGARWLSAYADEDRTEHLASHDVFELGRYRIDADGVSRTPGVLAPVCLRLDDVSGGVVVADAVSLSGHVAHIATFPVTDEHRLVLSAAVTQDGAESSSGADTAADGDDGTISQVTFTDGDLNGVAITSQGSPAALTGAGIDLTISRGGAASEPDRFTATISLSSSLGSVLATARGEARLLDGDWQLRGSTTYTGGTWNVAEGSGGFTASLDPAGAGSTDDDALSWQVDGLVTSTAS